LLRLAHAMDGKDISPPPPPKYGDLRLQVDPKELKAFAQQWAQKEEARKRIEARNQTGIMQSWTATDEEEHFKKYVSDGEEQEETFSGMRNALPPGQDDEDRPQKQRSMDSNPKPSPSPSRDASSQEDFAFLKEYNDAYEKKVDPNTAVVTYTILDEPVEEDFNHIKWGAGIGATHRTLSSREKEAELKRWQAALTGRIPDQPTFEELGLGNRVFLLEERRKRVAEETEKAAKRLKMEEEEKKKEETDKKKLEQEEEKKKVEAEKAGAEADVEDGNKEEEETEEEESVDGETEEGETEEGEMEQEETKKEATKERKTKKEATEEEEMEEGEMKDDELEEGEMKEEAMEEKDKEDGEEADETSRTDDKEEDTEEEASSSDESDEKGKDQKKKVNDKDFEDEEDKDKEGKAESARDKADSGNNDGTKSEEEVKKVTDDAKLVKRKPVSLEPIPSFYEQDFKRIHLIHADLMASSIHEHARRRIAEVTMDYNQAFRDSSDVYNRRMKVQTDLNNLMTQHRLEASKLENEYNIQVTFARAQWEKRKREFEIQKSKKAMQGMFGQMPIGTNGTQNASAHPDQIINNVGLALARVVDLVVIRVESGLDDEQFEDFVPPPPPNVDRIVVDQSTGETLGQRHERAESGLRRELTSLSQRLQQCEEDRKRAWRKMLKTKAEFEMPQSRRGRVDPSQANLLPMPPLRANQTTAIPTANFPPPAMPTYGTSPQIKQSRFSNTAMTGSDSKYSAAKVRERISSDGTVVPVTEPKRNKDGLYQRPAGRTRKGMNWDSVRGIWVPTDHP